MTVSKKEFESFVTDGVAAIPERSRALIQNVAFLVANEPTAKQKRENHIRKDETLLGLYEGIPRTARGEEYGGLAMPDKITIFQRPIEEAVHAEIAGHIINKRSLVNYELDEMFLERVRQIVIDTVWHEVAHHFGLDEAAVEKREKEEKNSVYYTNGKGAACLSFGRGVGGKGIVKANPSSARLRRGAAGDREGTGNRSPS